MYAKSIMMAIHRIIITADFIQLKRSKGSLKNSLALAYHNDNCASAFEKLAHAHHLHLDLGVLKKKEITQFNPKSDNLKCFQVQLEKYLLMGLK